MPPAPSKERKTKKRAVIAVKKTTKLLAALLALLLVLSLAGCGAKSAGTADSYFVSSTTADAPAAAEAASYSDSNKSAADTAGGVSGSENRNSGTGELNAEKIIYSADAQVETTDYEGTVQAVYDMVKQYGGFMESTSVSGNDYYNTSRGYASARSASFVIRIPSDSFSAMTGSLSTLGNVPYCNTYSNNVTYQYYDVQSRLTAYQTQETRLLDMLKVAETVEDMLAIQQQLTEVQYQIDSLQSTLKNYDNQVDYSTVNLSVQEVEKYTPQTPVTLSYWEKMSTGFQRSLKSVGEFFTDLFLFVGSNLPVLLVLAVCAVVLVLLLRRWTRNRGARTERRAARRERKAARRSEKAARRAAGKGAAPEPPEKKE